MEERITIKKASMLKDLVLIGLQAKGYELIRETASRYPIKIFYNGTVGSVVLYDLGPLLDDELVFVNLGKPMKVRVLIKEYRSKQSVRGDENRFDEVADMLEDLLSTHQDPKPLDDASKALRIVK
jgi:hypothetical protein